MSDTHQLCTFYIDDLLLGIDVDDVQEVLQAQFLTRVPLASESVAGLINLRGQIITAVNLRACLNRPWEAKHQNSLSLIVRSKSTLISLLVDRMGDVIDVDEADFAAPPESVDRNTVELIRGAYRLPDTLLLVLDSEQVVTHVTGLHDSGRTA
jgi:purine-binding chemotaxis protein CheW